jgi:DNA-binding transcriptional MerR regulator
VAEYRVDELARAAGTTVRNVRVYQDRGLLPPPRRQGRVGLYSDAHLARLRLIGQLLERGFTFVHITDMLRAWEHGRDVRELLGLEEAITGPWSDEIPTYVTAGDLEEMFGEEATDEVIERAVTLGILEPEGERYRVPSPRLLHAGAELRAAGVPIDAILALAETLERDMTDVAERFVETITRHVVAKVAPNAIPTSEEARRLGELLPRLRPLAQMAVDAQLARAMERKAQEVLGERLAAAGRQDRPA